MLSGVDGVSDRFIRIDVVPIEGESEYCRDGQESYYIHSDKIVQPRGEKYNGVDRKRD